MDITNNTLPIESIIWTPTMKLRWVDMKKADKPSNAVRYINDIYWDSPDGVVLQQMWQGNLGDTKWVDVPLELTPNKPPNQ